jgi:hypothetical protein
MPPKFVVNADEILSGKYDASPPRKLGAPLKFFANARALRLVDCRSESVRASQRKS